MANYPSRFLHKSLADERFGVLCWADMQPRPPKGQDEKLLHRLDFVLLSGIIRDRLGGAEK